MSTPRDRPKRRSVMSFGVSADDGFYLHTGAAGSAPELQFSVLAAVSGPSQLAQVTAELVHLPPQVHVAEQLVGELLQLRPLLGRHRVEHRLHRRHSLSQLLEQLVE